MAFSFEKHTADVRMRVCAKTRKALFTDALLGMMSLIYSKALEPNKQANKTTRTIALQAGDQTILFIDFLNECLALSHINKEVYNKVTFTTLSENSVKAELEGVKTKSFDKDVKAVTYHEAAFRQNKMGDWETTIVFDI